jgi:hypothetical protein
MATAEISFLIADAKHLRGGVLQLAALRSQGTVEKITIGGASVPTSAGHPGNGHFCFVRIWTDGDCRIACGSAPTATTNHARLTGSAAVPRVEYFGVQQGDKVAVIAA